MTSIAWHISSSALIDEVMVWNSSNKFYIHLDSKINKTEGDNIFIEKQWCYIPDTDQDMISLALTLYTTGKTAVFHCYDTEENTNGVMGRKLHRIRSSK